MNRDELKMRVMDLLEDYAAEEEVWGDSAQLCINPESLTVTLTSDEQPEYDCYDVMEFLQPSPSDPACWIPDPEAVDALLDEYFA